MEYNETFTTDCSDNCILKTEKHFLNRGYIVKSISRITGIDNKTFGDLKIELFKNGISRTAYVDYKKQTRDRPYIPIELIQVGVQGNYDSWLYNSNIDFCIYELKDGSMYFFRHSELLKIAKQNNTDVMWNTCIVYNRNPENYINERNYITEKLNSFVIAKDGSNIKADHINGAFNYRYDGTKHHSGFCLNLSLDTVERYKI